MPLPSITLKRLQHRSKDCIGLYFDYNKELIAHTKKQLLAINSPIDTMLDEAKKEKLLLDIKHKR